MGKVRIEEALEDFELEEYDNKDNLCYFEEFCCNCDNFETDRCPKYGDVDRTSKSKGCDKFED